MERRHLLMVAGAAPAWMATWGHAANSTAPSSRVELGESSSANELASLRSDLRRIASQRIYFGHQSVGANLMSGVQLLANQAGVALKIAQNENAQSIGGGVFAHTYVAENTFPLKKIDAFNQAMGPKATGLDAALLKFCFLDFTATTDVNAIFTKYRATMEGLRQRNPGLRIVHITAPLTIIQTGPKAFLKRLIGRAPYGAMENIRREEYNALLRTTYGGHESVFDLARIESTRPDGSQMTVSWQDQSIPAMVPSYSDDGQHLNTEGQLRAARELIAILANGSVQGTRP